jgi:hypothetical protein
MMAWPRAVIKSRGEALGVLFLALQVTSIGYARLVPERFFCWAPFDIHTQYVVGVEVGGERLTSAAISQRYRYPSHGWEPRSIHNLFSIIAQYESAYGATDDARVVVDYSINGHPLERWTWPTP